MQIQIFKRINLGVINKWTYYIVFLRYLEKRIYTQFFGCVASCWIKYFGFGTLERMLKLIKVLIQEENN